MQHNHILPVVTLIGDPSVKAAYDEAHELMVCAGLCVFTMGLGTTTSLELATNDPRIKDRIDAGIYQMIDLSDAVYFVNTNGQVANVSKLQYAIDQRKDIGFAEFPNPMQRNLVAASDCHAVYHVSPTAFAQWLYDNITLRAIGNPALARQFKAFVAPKEESEEAK